MRASKGQGKILNSTMEGHAFYGHREDNALLSIKESANKIRYLLDCLKRSLFKTREEDKFKILAKTLRNQNDFLHVPWLK